jgi:5-methyltetrahydrofolate--homocysteine methyltransferase
VNAIQQLIDEQGYVLVDGAMGTMLFASGLEHGDSPELWNVEHPDRVAAVHRAYLEAGSRILLSNTFGGTRYRLQLHNMENRVAELNRAGASLLREVVRTSDQHALVAGDIGPSGQLLQPLGELTFDEAVDGFAEQAAALVEGGVDLLWIETMSALEEVQAAVEGARQASDTIPIVTTMTFDTRGRTMMGITPEAAIKALLSYGAAAVGGNCGNGPEEVVTVIEKMHAVSPETILVAKANAGIPELIKGRPVYRATPAEMAEYAVQVYNAGARVVGTCCGSTAAHIQAIAEALKTAPSVKQVSG